MHELEILPRRIPTIKQNRFCLDLFVMNRIPDKQVRVMQMQIRDERIRTEYSNGYTIPELVARYALSNARIHQILHA